MTNDSSVSPIISAHAIEKPDSVDVRRVLNQILASPSFRNSKQCSSLLSYMVEHTLAGDESLLRERVIGADVFGRPAGYETNEDPVVRLRASEVRKRLAQYYLAESNTDSVYIEIPSGGYRATFRIRGGATAFHDANAIPHAARVEAEHGSEAPTFAVLPAAIPSQKRSGNSWRWAAIFLVMLVLAAAVCTLLLVHEDTQQKAFRTFWAPWASSSKPVIISVGSNAVYRLKDEYVDRYAKEHGLENDGREIYIPFAANAMLPTEELYPAQSSFVALGDVSAVSSIVATLTREKVGFQERFPNDVSFAELRNTPSVLVGGFNNPMTMALTRHLEFVMRAGREIDDTFNPNRKWLLNTSGDSRDTADYAILTRLVPLNGDAPVIAVAGLGQYGTLAAADLICNPDGVHWMADKLPSDWAEKNLEIILRIGVLDFKPTTPTVVAYHTW